MRHTTFGMANLRPAAFLDRDGTLIRDAHYLHDPDAVDLLPGAAAALRRLSRAGFALVVITNQSGIARGLFTERDYEAVRARLDVLLRAEGVVLAATYHCPHHPDFGAACECRKPGTLLFERAITEQQLDPTHSVLIGDRWRDIAPAGRLGARGILVASTDTPVDEVERSRAEAAVAATLDEAVSLVLASHEG